MNHTKGEWNASEPKIQEESGQTYFSITTNAEEKRGGSWVIPGFYYPHSIQTPEEMEANAKLIAAAPNLLAKCIKIKNWLIMLAENSEKEAEKMSGHLKSLAEANIADAKNYRKTAEDISNAINKATS